MSILAGFAEDVVGVDITDDSIIAARVHATREGRFELRNAGWTEYAPEATDKSVAALLRKLWQQCGMPSHTVCSCLRSRSMMLRHFKHPLLSDRDRESALWLQAEETLQVPRRDIVMDWHVHADGPPPSPASGDSPGSEGLLVAALRKDIDRHLALLELAGLSPVIVDVGCMAVCNLFLALNGAARIPGAVCLLNLSTHTADMAVLTKDGWMYPHMLFSRSTAWEGSADYLCASISDVLKYYHFKLRREPVQRLVLTGRIPPQSDFLRVISERAGLPVDVWNPLSELTVKGAGLRQRVELDPATGPLMATSLGLALRRH